MEEIETVTIAGYNKFCKALEEERIEKNMKMIIEQLEELEMSIDELHDTSEIDYDELERAIKLIREVEDILEGEE